MLETTGDIWDFYDEGYTLIITTNGYVKNNGDAVLGAGIAKQAVKRFPDLPARLGERLRGVALVVGNAVEANQVFHFPDLRLITLPVKHDWWENADLDLILRSIRQLAGDLWEDEEQESRFVLVRPGCGNGGLEWDTVRPVIAPHLDDRFTVVDNGSGDRDRRRRRA
jgi:hypothetical protein